MHATRQPDSDTAGSTLFSIPEHELRDCPDTPEHKAACLGFSIKRMQQLGFQVPHSLSALQEVSCKAVMMMYETDVLIVLKSLLDDYERLRAERDDIRASEKQQRHELGRISRRSGSLERRLLAKEKKLAEAEFRLEEQAQAADRLRAEARREAQKARLAQSEMQRLAEQVRHRQQRTERELFEARQRIDRDDDGRRWPPQPITAPGAAYGRRTRPLHPRGGKAAVPEVAATAATSERYQATARHAVVVAADRLLFDTVEMPPLLAGQPARGRPGRNRSVPPAQVWYTVPKAPADHPPTSTSCSDANSGGLGGEQTAISLAETIDASGGFGGCWCQGTASSDASLAASSVSSGGAGRRSGGRSDAELRD